jgi:hypothetical protein
MSRYAVHRTNSGVYRRDERLAGANDLAHYSRQRFLATTAAAGTARGETTARFARHGSSLVVCLHLLRNEQSANDQQTTTRLLQVARIATNV